ncbi:DNA repair protein RAD51 homolog 4 isoform X2 [Phycodurus eques]|uniref:DNA repair protein RAD51 homolog 4 isoform X2 n=1 Tax=Phycodurus eques TaxID=693459 RepID=UPI002ACD7BAC|nr:DNA repair protein RAD51 homolog 4 isoform X2 [Phycodurus eques]
MAQIKASPFLRRTFNAQTACSVVPVFPQGRPADISSHPRGEPLRAAFNRTAGDGRMKPPSKAWMRCWIRVCTRARSQSWQAGQEVAKHRCAWAWRRTSRKTCGKTWSTWTPRGGCRPAACAKCCEARRVATTSRWKPCRGSACIARSTSSPCSTVCTVLVATVFGSFLFVLFLFFLGYILRQEASGGSVKALIVDSVSAVIAPLLGSRHHEGMHMMSQVAIALKTMAKDFNIAALVTNHVTRSDEGEVRPGLGVSWSHVPRTRVLLERLPAAVGRPALRSATLIKSSRRPCFMQAELDLECWSRCESATSGKRKLDTVDS